MFPTRVVASASAGIATGEPYNCVPQTEDTITLLVDWQSKTSERHRATAYVPPDISINSNQCSLAKYSVYTASWTAPLTSGSGVHSAQHWYYMAEKVRSVICDTPDASIIAHTLLCHLRVRSTSTRPIVATTSSTTMPASCITTPSSAYYRASRLSVSP
jgi:hypothetical protein